jgi:hypothetical protein
VNFLKVASKNSNLAAKCHTHESQTIIGILEFVVVAPFELVSREKQFDFFPSILERKANGVGGPP